MTSTTLPERSIGRQLTLALELMDCLQEQEYTTGSALARRLNRSTRTIERLFKQLSDAEMPVYSGPQGYGMTRQTGGMPCYLTPSEQLALSLMTRVGLTGLGAAHASIKGLGKRLRKHMSEATQQHLGDLEQVVAADDRADEVASEVWEALSIALSRQLRVRFNYHPIAASDLTLRQVDPWGLIRTGRAWYLQGFDLDRQASRTFRLNRIKGLESLPVRVQRPSDYEPSKGLFHPWDIGDAQAVEAELELQPTLLRWLAENPAHPRQTLQDDRLRISVVNQPLFLDWLLALDGARLVGPESLKETLRGRIRERERALLA